MEPDSFLDLLSPGFNDLPPEWGSPSDLDPYSMPASALAWLTDGFINTEGIEEFDEEEEDDDDEFEAQPKTPISTSSTLNGSILSNASEYSSVLKLSDIASALHNFSKADGAAGTLHHHRRARPHRSSPSLSASSLPHSPSVPGSSFATRSSLPTGCAFGKYSAHVLQMQPCSFNGSPMSDAKDVSVSHVHAAKTGSTQPTIEEEVWNKESSDSGAANERESSSKATSEGINGWDVSDNEENVDEDEGDNDSAAYHEGMKPSVSHVRIIRRPNSNCGQALAPSPKRAKLDLVKAEATSSCETTSLQDDKDGDGCLKQMRKDGMSQREVHILSERQRRKSMRESFSILQSLVPKLKLKHTDRITVLTEVISYIQSLRGTLEELERKKADMMELLGLTTKGKSRRRLADVEGSITYVNANDSGSSDEKGGDRRSGGWCSLQNGERVAMVEVTVRMCGADVFITLNTPHRRGVWSGVLALLHKFSIEVSNATLATSGDSGFHCIHAKATNLSCVEGVDLQEKLEGVIVKKLRRPSRKGLF